jgi:hypothetical protein
LTATTPALDIDILDEAAASAVEALVREKYEERGAFLVRFGKAPRRLITFRCMKPFKKIAVSLISPSGSTDQKLELLADGQQFVAHGIHPDTGRPYRWFGGDIIEIEHGDLPEIDEAAARELIEAAADLLVAEHGYKRVQATKPNGKGNGQSEDWSNLVEKIRNGEALHDSLRDLAAKLIASGMSGAAAVNLLRATMEAYTGKRDARWRARYNDIPRCVGTAEGKVQSSPVTSAVTLEDFFSLMTMHSYIFVPSGEMWPTGSVNARVPPVLVGDKYIPASAYLDRARAVEQMSWQPGAPQLIEDRLIVEGGWIERKGARVFNLYRPPIIKPGNPKNATRWIEHANRIYPGEAEHIIKWLAQRVQRPGEKINHCILLGGTQGIGKDTLLAPVQAAIGPWNFAEVSPSQLTGRFNAFLKSVILRVSEAHDLGEVDRFGFYEAMKSITTTPPETKRVDQKFMQEYYIANVVGIILTTNHRTNGIYLPAEDRRHFVCWSPLKKGELDAGYFNALWSWYANGGTEDVAAYLRELDVSAFDPKAPPPQTEAFWDIVRASDAPEDADLSDALDALGNPDAVTVHQIDQASSDASFVEWLRDRKNRRNIPHRFERVGYVMVRNSFSQQGLWRINGRKQAVYAKSALSAAERLAAARALGGQ